MELKEAILSTLAELQDSPAANIAESPASPNEEACKKEEDSRGFNHQNTDDTLPPVSTDLYEAESEESGLSLGERRFLEAIRERILVLFEGMQSPNNRSVEAKVELSLNFFDYLLSVIDERLLGKK